MSEKVLGNLERGLLFVISAPAGTGKTTLVQMLVSEFADVVVQSLSCTTRKKRSSDDRYKFISEPEFEKMAQEGAFLEHATVFGYHYGTPQAHVEELLAQGKHVVLVIDTKGAMQVKATCAAIFIFIAPPSMQVLEQRLRGRSTESEEKVEKRLAAAKEEMAMAPEYDYTIVNDDLETSYQMLKSIFIEEEEKRR